MTASMIVHKEIKPVIDYLIDTEWRLKNNDKIPYEKIRQDLKNGLNILEEKLKGEPQLYEISGLIKYAITVLCDEVLNFINWEYQKTWQNSPLEKELYKAAQAGKKFYQLLENDALRHPVLAEVFYLCFVLAFQKRHIDDPQTIQGYKQKLYHAAQLSHILPDTDRFLSPGANKTIQTQISNFPPLFGTTSIIIFLVVLLGIYILVSQFLWHDVVSLISDISNHILSKGY
jgi:type IV/VI secretion system ImpK/VasF family protein